MVIPCAQTGGAPPLSIRKDVLCNAAERLKPLQR